MSYDRVLPKPAALHYEAPQATLPRQTSNLLEHKIMNDNVVSKFAMMDRHHMNGDSMSDASCRFVNDLRLNGVSNGHASSLNRAKTVLNKIVSNPPSESSKPVAAPLITKDIPIRERSTHGSERSSSASPVKSAMIKEPVTQFCLCQPDPKIPRPRNGEFYLSVIVLFT
jgi:HMG box factor